MRLLLIILALLQAFTVKIFSQETIAASGGNATGTGGSVSYTVGQVFYSSHSGTTGSITEGVQQLFEISVVSAIDEAADVTLSVLAYPNPVTDFLELKVEGEVLKDLSYQLFDLSGRLLQSNIIANEVLQSVIDMQNYKPATYFVKILQGNKEVKTFKIIKTH